MIGEALCLIIMHVLYSIKAAKDVIDKTHLNYFSLTNKINC